MSDRGIKPLDMGEAVMLYDSSPKSLPSHGWQDEASPGYSESDVVGRTVGLTLAQSQVGEFTQLSGFKDQ